MAWWVIFIQNLFCWRRGQKKTAEEVINYVVSQNVLLWSYLLCECEAKYKSDFQIKSTTNVSIWFQIQIENSHGIVIINRN